MADSERLQKVVNEIAPARWQEIQMDHFRAEFFAEAESADNASGQIGKKVELVEERLADLGVRVENLTEPGPGIPPRRPPKDIVSYAGG
jgi:hypothetical protein